MVDIYKIDSRFTNLMKFTSKFINTIYTKKLYFKFSKNKT